MSDLASQIESILFVAGRPVKLAEIADAVKKDMDDVEAALAELLQLRRDSGVVLIEKDHKYQLVTRPDNSTTVGEFLVAEQREKLTDAAVETLSIILYKQPVTRAEVEAIRGVNSQYILRQLLIRGLIEKTPSPSDARRLVYKTTLEFMTHLGVTDMKNLPDFEELTKSVTLPEEPRLTSETAQPNSEDRTVKET